MAKRSRPISWWVPTACARPCASKRLPSAAPLYAGYSAWRALIAENAIPPDTHRELFEFMSFGLPPGEQFLGYPVAGPDNDLRPGHRRFNVVWYRPADEKTKLQWLLTDERGTTHAISIPPPLIRREAIAEMRADAERLLAPQFRQIVRLIEEPILQPIYDLEFAAHGVRPGGDRRRCGLRGAPARGGRRVEGGGRRRRAGGGATGRARRRRRRSSATRRRGSRENYRIIERARHLGAYLQATRTQEEQARAGMHSTDGAVIAETAVLDFLRA